VGGGWGGGWGGGGGGFGFCGGKKKYGLPVTFVDTQTGRYPMKEGSEKKVNSQQKKYKGGMQAYA